MDEIQKKWGVAQRPEINRKFTTDEVARALGVTTATVSAICSKYGIVNEIVQEKVGRKAYYTYENMREIRAHLHGQAHVRYTPPALVEKAEEHPLVTDKRCLNFNYWPDTVPKCFKGGEYD